MAETPNPKTDMEAAQTSTLDREITALSEALRRPAPDLLPRCIRSLIKAGFAFPSDMIDKDEALDIYGFALAGLPAPALRRVVERLIRGEMDQSATGLLPRPPALAAMVRAEAATMRADLVRMRDRRASMEELRAYRDRAPKEEAMKARVRALVAGVVGRAAAEPEGGAT